MKIKKKTNRKNEINPQQLISHSFIYLLLLFLHLPPRQSPHAQDSQSNLSYTASSWGPPGRIPWGAPLGTKIASRGPPRGPPVGPPLGPPLGAPLRAPPGSPPGAPLGAPLGAPQGPPKCGGVGNLFLSLVVLFGDLQGGPAGAVGRAKKRHWL